MRCLILGATGHLGSQLVAACADHGFAQLGTYYTWPHADYVPLDLRDSESVHELLADYQPDVTFLAAGLACSGYAEAHAVECRQITIDGTREVARAVARHGGRLVVFSSDEVFGECPSARREDDPLAPAGELARCQIAAERLVRELLPERHLIVRTGWLYGPDERSRDFANRFVRKLAQSEAVAVGNDRYGQPTYSPDLAAVAVELARQGITGTLHAVGPDRHTEFSFARQLAHVFGYDADLIEGFPSREVDDSPRPQRVWLDRFKLRGILGPRAIRTVSEGLRALRNELTPSRFLRAA